MTRPGRGRASRGSRARAWGRAALGSLVALALVAPSSVAEAAAAVGAAAFDESDAFFRRGEIPTIRLELAPGSADRLRAEPRAYAPATLVVDGKPVSAAAGVKLKGSAGSFQPFDERPALTIDVDRFGKGELFHGLEKFHLNNSAQDPSLLAEWTAAEILGEAGYPHVRVGHARVWLGERDLGVYVLKESFDERFLARAFPGERASGGNLYDGGFCQDVDAELELDEGRKPVDRADLRALAEACREGDMKRRWQRLEELVDVRALVRFVALEAMLGHWDGYSFNSNNYRLYFEPGRKARFLPHGMDQVLQDPEASVLDGPRGLVAASVLRKPEWRELYRKEVVRLLGAFDARRLVRRIEPVAARVGEAMRSWNVEAAAAQADAARGFAERIVARERSLVAQSRAPEPKPIQFKVGKPVLVRGWHPMSESEDAVVEDVEIGGAPFHRVACGPSGRCVAGWRKSVLLERGRYRLEGFLRLEGVERLEEPEDDGARRVGAALRVSGRAPAVPTVGGADAAEAGGETGGTGSGERRVAFEFEVEESVSDVELVFELRASRGSAAVRIDSLVLERLPARNPKQP